VEEKERLARHDEDADGAAIMPPKSPAQVSEHRGDRIPVDGSCLTISQPR
jgi:riboflavin synthase alpha subunit